MNGALREVATRDVAGEPLHDGSDVRNDTIDPKQLARITDRCSPALRPNIRVHGCGPGLAPSLGVMLARVRVPICTPQADDHERMRRVMLDLEAR